MQDAKSLKEGCIEFADKKYENIEKITVVLLNYDDTYINPGLEEEMLKLLKENNLGFTRENNFEFEEILFG